MSDIVKSAREKWDRDKSAWSDVYERAREDLHFLSDDQYAQWDSTDYKSRTERNRPAETVDQLSQFIHQVANDIRMNTPTIKVIPGDEEASVEAAEKIKGIIKKIEYASNADDAYDTGVLNSIKCSIGFIRVDHDFADDESALQKLVIKRVVNPLACMIDSDSIECDGSDAKHGTIIDKMLVSDFKKQYPGFDPISFDDGKGRKDGEHIYIAEHFVLDIQEKEVGYLDDKTSEDFDKRKKYKAKRKIRKVTVRRYKLSGQDVLEETTFPGKYIPLVPVYGEEAWIEGKRHLFSLIRKSKGAQRMYNLWASLETELLMKQPQAPVLAAAGSIEAYSADWLDPSKSMALRYDHVDANGNQIPKPERLAPPTIPTGIINARREAVDDIKATMGMYNASIGQRSNESSGVAIDARKAEGDVATYHFGDNLVRSVTQVGRILVCALPQIYDTERVVPSIGAEDEHEFVGINGAKVKNQEETVDLKRGKYDVRVTTGASFTTQRQETAAALTQMFSSNPEMMTAFGDIYFKNSDFAGAQALAERAKKLLPPNLIEQEGEEVDPEKQQLLMQIEEMKAAMAQLQQEAQSNQNDQAKVQIEAEKVGIDAQIKAKELEQKDRELDLKQAELEAKYALEQEKLKTDLAKSRIDAKKTVSPDVALGDPELQESGIAPMAQMMEGFAQIIQASSQNTAQAIENLAQMQAEGTQALLAAVTAPKTTQVIRDSQGRISAGVQTVQ